MADVTPVHVYIKGIPQLAATAIYHSVNDQGLTPGTYAADIVTLNNGVAGIHVKTMNGQAPIVVKSNVPNITTVQITGGNPTVSCFEMPTFEADMHE